MPLKFELKKEVKLRYKPMYLKVITQQLKWKVMFDADPNIQDNLYDIQMILTKKIDGTQVYGFVQITGNNEASITGYKEAKAKAASGEFAKFLDRLDSLIYPYDIDDVIAQCLHLGYHLEDVYQNNGKKLNLVLDEDKAMTLIKTFSTKGSPLTNIAAATRPKKLKSRGKTYFNSAMFNPNNVPQV